MARSYKQQKRGGGKFVALHHWVMQIPAWQSLRPIDRALFVELKRRYNGRNNGRVYLSHRDAAEALNVSRPTIAKAFATLEARGFIVETAGASLGSDGKGIAKHYRLSDENCDGKPPSKEFAKLAKV